MGDSERVDVTVLVKVDHHPIALSMSRVANVWVA